MRREQTRVGGVDGVGDVDGKDADDLMMDTSAGDEMKLDGDLDDMEQDDGESGDLVPTLPGTPLDEYLNSQSVAEETYNDPLRKHKCHRCRMAFTSQAYLTR